MLNGCFVNYDDIKMGELSQKTVKKNERKIRIYENRCDPTWISHSSTVECYSQIEKKVF